MNCTYYTIDKRQSEHYMNSNRVGFFSPFQNHIICPWSAESERVRRMQTDMPMQIQGKTIHSIELNKPCVSLSLNSSLFCILSHIFSILMLQSIGCERTQLELKKNEIILGLIERDGLLCVCFFIPILPFDKSIEILKYIFNFHKQRKHFSNQRPTGKK